DEEAVALMAGLLPAVLGDERAQGLVVPADDALPGLVADRVDELRRAHDVGEQERPRHLLLRRLGRRALGLVAEQLARAADVEPRPEALEGGARRLQLELRRPIVTFRAKCCGEDEPRL